VIHSGLAAVTISSIMVGLSLVINAPNAGKHILNYYKFSFITSR